MGSLGVATVQFDDERVDADVRVAGDRAESVGESALRDAVQEAGETAAAQPVVDPASTPYGELLDADRTYRSYLELLIAIELRERTGDLEQRVDGTTASVELPSIDDRSSADAALNATSVRVAGTGLVEATVEDATVVVRRDGTVVDERDAALTVTVATPALDLHDRTADFEERLDGGLEKEGSVTRALTGGLYALAWPRGWGQYLGLPIDDPIANRHVELLTNLAVIDAQRSTLGEPDAAAERGTAAAAVDVAANEAGSFVDGGFSEAGFPEPDAEAEFDAITSPEPGSTAVGVDESADRAMADVLRADPDGVPTDHPTARSLEELVRAATTVEATLETRRSTTSRTLVDRVGPENDSEWRHSEGESWFTVETVADGDGSATAPNTGSDWSTARTATREVVLEEHVPVTYVHRETGDRASGRATYERTVDVGLAVAHRPAPVEGLPDRPFQPGAASAHDELVDRAVNRLLGDDAVDEVARDVATDDVDDRTVRLAPDDRQRQEDAAYDELADVRDQLRTVSTTAERTFVATESDPAGDLRDRLRADRTDYVDAPARYDGLEERAAVAARAALVDRTIERVHARSQAGVAAQEELEDGVDQVGSLPEGGLDQLLEVGLDYVRPSSEPVNATPPAPEHRLRVSGRPSYLDRDEPVAQREPLATGASIDAASADATDGGSEATVDAPESNETHYALNVRTRTLPSLDAGDVASEIAAPVADALFQSDDDVVPLPRAARQLRALDRTPEPAVLGADDLADEREALREEVRDGVDVLEERSVDVVASETDLDRQRSEQVVDRALANRSGAADRALAFSEGEAAAWIGTTAGERSSVSDREADRVRTLLQDEVDRALAADATHAEDVVGERTIEEARDVGEEVLEDAAESGLEAGQDVLEEQVGDLPMLGIRGAPLLPAPGYWAATANGWHVQVEGEYARFTVSAPTGDPAGGGSVDYVRDGSSAAIDVTGDGSPEHLGDASRVSFEGSTTVVVVVGPNGPGVGNAEADFGERSPGWEQREA